MDDYEINISLELCSRFVFDLKTEIVFIAIYYYIYIDSTNNYKSMISY